MQLAFKSLFACLIAAAAMSAHAKPLPSIKDSTVQIFGEMGFGKHDSSLKTGKGLFGAKAVLPFMPLSSGVLFAELGIGGLSSCRIVDPERIEREFSLYGGYGALGYPHLLNKDFYIGAYAASEFTRRVFLPERQAIFGWGFGSELQYKTVRLSSNFYFSGNTVVEERSKLKGASSGDLRVHVSFPGIPWVAVQGASERFFSSNLVNVGSPSLAVIDGHLIAFDKGPLLRRQLGIEVTPIPLVSVKYECTNIFHEFLGKNLSHSNHAIVLKLRYQLGQPFVRQLDCRRVSELQQVRGGLVQPLNRHEVMSIICSSS